MPKIENFMYRNDQEGIVSHEKKPIPHFWNPKKAFTTDRQTDGPTDQRTDGLTKWLLEPHAGD